MARNQTDASTHHEQATPENPTPSSRARQKKLDAQGATNVSRAPFSITPDRNQVEEEVDFASLGDGTLLELIEDPEDPARTSLVVFKQGRHQITHSFECAGKIFVPRRRCRDGLADVRLPRGILPSKCVEELNFRIFNLISLCVDLSDEYRAILASFILYTWVADRLPTAVYLSVIGLPGSGKTNLLEVLALLCRRALLVSDITPAATWDACSKYNPTLLMDENEWQARGGSRIRQQLRAGTTQNLLAKRMHRTGHSFGPKVLSSLGPPDDPALLSRCIRIPMTETSRTDLIKPTDPRLLQLTDEFQKQLLEFRLAHYKSIRPAVIPGAEKLRPRSRDLLNSLAAPLAGDKLCSELILAFFREIHEPENKEILPPAQSAVLAALFTLIHLSTDCDCITVGSLGRFVNKFLKEVGERITLQPRKTGAVLTSLGISSRERTNQGWKITLDHATRLRIHNLTKTYGNEYLSNTALRLVMPSCAMCKEVGNI